jgi:glycosyltransferase involved in cell wall biosynthesis
MAPVPWFPFRSSRFGGWAEFARIPRFEARNGINVHYPRYPVIPKVGMSVAPLLMAAAMRKPLRNLLRDGGDFDIIDAHYFYPDGVAAVFLGRWLNKPVVISARGSDINRLVDFAVPRRWIRWAAANCRSIITVSQDLADRLAEQGVTSDKMTVLRNGVDLRRFRLEDRSTIRRELNITRRMILSVGNLVPDKGHDLVIRALADVFNAELLIIGSGPERRTLEKLAESLQVNDRVRFLDNLPQEALAQYYNAADVLVLASVSEGMPNVVLESIACGTPVVATATGGVSEILSTVDAGLLVADRNGSGVARAVNALLDKSPNRADTRRHAESFAWDEVIQRQVEVYRSVLRQ